MDANGFSVVDNRAGIKFGVELYVPWDAPEAVVDVSSAGVVPLCNVPDVIGLVGRRESAVESRGLQGRDARTVRVLVPDCRHHAGAAAQPSLPPPAPLFTANVPGLVSTVVPTRAPQRTPRIGIVELQSIHWIHVRNFCFVIQCHTIRAPRQTIRYQRDVPHV